jgi:hypothetical protein
MKTGKPTQEMFRLLLGLAIVAVITVVIISTLHGPAPGSHTVVASSSPTQPPQQTATPPQPPTTVVPYPYPNPYEFLTSTAAVRQTAAGPLDTQWAIMLATYLATTPSPTPIRTFPPTGTREDMYVKPSGEKMGLDAQNAWFGVLDGRPVSVYAGALSGVPEQGAIYIFVEFPTGGVNEQILTPTQHGGVRVVGEHNNRLTLVSADGTTYYFDIPTLGFVSSLTAIAPSATPSPTSVPYIPPPTSTPVPTFIPYPTPGG